jgi:hypothetical protein
MAIADVAEYTHLSVADIKGLADELDPIHPDVKDSRGAGPGTHPAHHRVSTLSRSRRTTC